MMVKQIISKSKGGNRMEVIAIEDNILRTLHIHKNNDSLIATWRYFAGCLKNGTKIFLPVSI